MHHRVRCLLLCLLLCLMTACGEEPVPMPEPEPVHVPKHQITPQTTWENMILNAITPVCSFEITGDTLEVFPNYEGDSYIELRKFYFSSNDMWKQLIASTDSENLLKKEGYTLCAVNGVTYAFIPYDEESGYLVSTRLTSGYCEKMADEVWRVLSGS